MLIKDLYETNDLTDISDNKNDQSIAKKDDTRKTRLTLSRINQLRMLEDKKKKDYYDSLSKIKTQYGKQEEAEAAV